MASKLESGEMDFLRWLVKTIDKISRWSGYIFAPFALILTLVILYAVVMRFVFKDPPIWGTDISLILFSVYIVSGGAYTHLHKGHVRLDLFYDKYRTRGKAIFDISTAFVFYFFVIVVLYASFKECIFSTFTIQRTTGSYFNAVLWPGMWVLPLSALLLFLQGTAKFIRDCYFVATGNQLDVTEPVKAPQLTP
jgi:TRAP-type mannitol/chloroaromatic compound transport system permease small subunit